LADASKGIFDAIIVADASRWSRDNRKSKEGLQIFRDNGIRFFVGTSEYDLFNPEHTFFLGMAAEFGEFQARQQFKIDHQQDREGEKRNTGYRETSLWPTV
jgi:site-specific DNA recombinase